MKKISIVISVMALGAMLTGCNQYMMRAGVATVATVGVIATTAAIEREMPNQFVYANGAVYQVYGQCDQNGGVLGYFYRGNSSLNNPIAFCQSPNVVVSINLVQGVVCYDDQGYSYPVYAQCAANGIVLGYGCYTGRIFRTIPANRLYSNYRYSGGGRGVSYRGGVHY